MIPSRALDCTAKGGWRRRSLQRANQALEFGRGSGLFDEPNVLMPEKHMKMISLSLIRGSRHQDPLTQSRGRGIYLNVEVLALSLLLQLPKIIINLRQFAWGRHTVPRFEGEANVSRSIHGCKGSPFSPEVR
jgi:hypothetical protein